MKHATAPEATLIKQTHDGGATANRIIPLHGGAYLKLLAVIDAMAAPSSPLGRLVEEGIGSGHRLIAWRVRTDDIDVVAARQGLEVVSMSRSRPDGCRLSWRVTGVEGCVATRYLPFSFSGTSPTSTRL